MSELSWVAEGMKIEASELVRIDINRFEVHAAGRVLVLTRLEFDLLAYLMTHRHRVVSQEELVERVACGVHRPESSLIRVHVSHLRRKLGPMAAIIETVRGRGFRFNPQRCSNAVVSTPSWSRSSTEAKRRT